MSDQRVCERLGDAVGGTPLVRLRRSVPGFSGEVYAKLEFLNPGGSVKDRIARHMIERALADGRLRPGGVVVEASSGNTAMGLAMVAVEHGLRCVMVVRRQTSREKLDCLRAMGVELVLVDGDLPPEHPESYNRKARELAASIPGAFFPDQHNNRENNDAHYLTTGPEIWRQMDGRIDVFVCGIGTGGTVSGVSRYLKEQDPRVRVVAVDVAGSVFTDHFRTGRHGAPGRYLLEGLGDEEVIACPEFERIDEMLQVTDREAFLAARDLARSEGILAGGSSGAALWGVRQVIAGLGRPARVATIFCDSGTRYLSSIYCDDWMRRHGFLDGAAAAPPLSARP
ncbi:MAG: cysteine synthase family protein [Thermoanaerobaculia bacterium]|nr:cysteine synthase family protein [Thermoanaerobaculia bacterium]MCZ7651182.1 cysteine synthase family protein [Thermoanaerobaculia bacterium]